MNENPEQQKRIEELQQVYTAGWMLGWIHSGVAMAPSISNAPELPDRFRELAVSNSGHAANQPLTVATEDDDKRDPRIWRMNPRENSAIIVRHATVPLALVPIVYFVGLPNNARPIFAESGADSTDPWAVRMYFYVDNQNDKRVFDRKYVLARRGGVGELNGRVMDETGLTFEHLGNRYFVFRLY
jgi:hypothetical protein